MLCGLLPVTGGTLRVAGVDLRYARASARQHIGYVAQKFSLYGQLSVIENLEFFASAYGLRGSRKRARIDWAMRQFELGQLANLASGAIAGRLQAAACDGGRAPARAGNPVPRRADERRRSLARREFWQRITVLAEGGVTVIVTTHFMEEAEYCDRVAILDGGRILAQGTPAEIRARGRREGSRDAEHGGRLHRHRAGRRERSAKRGWPHERRHDDTQPSTIVAQAAAHLGADTQGKPARSSATRAASPSAS